MNQKSLFCSFLLFTLLPHQAKAQATPPTLGSAVKLTREKLKFAKPGASNSGVQSGYTAILRAPADSNDNYPSILGTIRFSTIKTTQNPQGSGSVNISCGGSMLSGPCTSAKREANTVSFSYKAMNFNYTSMLLRILNLRNADPRALLPSHWVENITGNSSVPMVGNIGKEDNTPYTIKYYTNYPVTTTITSSSPNNMSVQLQKN